MFETREFDSVLRIQSGETAVLGGLMQDSVERVEDMIPGLSSLPLLGQLFSQRKDVNLKTELVIFLRAIVVRDPSIEGDYQAFRELLPGADFLRKTQSGARRAAGVPVRRSDMSLLLEALKKAEKAKEDAQRRADAGGNELRLADDTPAAAPAKPVLTRPELPDITAPLEILSEDLAAKPAAGEPSMETLAPAPRRPAAAAAAAAAADAAGRQPRRRAQGVRGEGARAQSAPAVLYQRSARSARSPSAR